MTQKSTPPLQLTCAADLPALPRPRLVFFDLDGTLFDSRGMIGKQTQAAIEKLHALGVAVAIATGRPLFSCHAVLSLLRANGPSVFHSGALVVTPSDFRVLYERPLETEALLSLLEGADERGLYAELYSRDKYFISKPTALTAIHFHYLQQDPVISELESIASSETILKAVLLAQGHEQDKILRCFAAETPHLSWGIGYGRSHQDVTFGNITSPAASREAAFNAITTELGVNSAEVWAFGDGEADVPFLQLAGVGVAMANAPREVQHSANFVTRSVDEDGVGFALERLLAVAR